MSYGLYLPAPLTCSMNVRIIGTHSCLFNSSSMPPRFRSCSRSLSLFLSLLVVLFAVNDVFAVASILGGRTAPAHDKKSKQHDVSTQTALVGVDGTSRTRPVTTPPSSVPRGPRFPDVDLIFASFCLVQREAEILGRQISLLPLDGVWPREKSVSSAASDATNRSARRTQPAANEHGFSSSDDSSSCTTSSSSTEEELSPDDRGFGAAAPTPRGSPVVQGVGPPSVVPARGPPSLASLHPTFHPTVHFSGDGGRGDDAAPSEGFFSDRTSTTRASVRAASASTSASTRASTTRSRRRKGLSFAQQETIRKVAEFPQRMIQKIRTALAAGVLELVQTKLGRVEGGEVLLRIGSFLWEAPTVREAAAQERRRDRTARGGAENSRTVCGLEGGGSATEVSHLHAEEDVVGVVLDRPSSLVADAPDEEVFPHEIGDKRDHVQPTGEVEASFCTRVMGSCRCPLRRRPLRRVVSSQSRLLPAAVFEKIAATQFDLIRLYIDLAEAEWLLDSCERIGTVLEDRFFYVVTK